MKKILPFIFLFITLSTFSQKEANFWYFGNKAALDFNSGTPVPVSGSLLSTTEGCSSFADSNGNLLFYIGAPTSTTNNLTIWNKNNEAMPNGTNLEGDSSSSQSALTIPAPGKPNIYYIFTVGAPSSDNQGFWYYTVDMTLNGGLGDVVGGATDLSQGFSNNWSEKVTAVKSDACNEFWVISFRRPNIFYAYKVDGSGVDTARPVLSTINGYSVNQDGSRGYLKVSPDGTKLVAANMNSGTFLFNFDTVTGMVTNFNNSATTNPLNITGNGYGVEFSSSSERLYISTGNFSASTENLYQFDVTQPTFSDINDSRLTIHSYFNTRGALQLGPDAKIYWTSDGSSSISVINNPDAIGADVNYSHRSVSLGAGVNATQGLPPFISSIFSTIDIKDQDTDQIITNQSLQFCIGDDKILVPNAIPEGDTPPVYTWEFDNGTTSVEINNNERILELTNLQKTDTGKYTLTVELTDKCGSVTQYIGTFNIEVFEAATATSPEDIFYCDDDVVAENDFYLHVLQDAEILSSLADPTSFTVLYFDTLAKANANDAGTDLPNPYQVNTASTQTIYARVQNIRAPNACFAITEFELEVTNEPEPIQPSVYRLCDDTTSVGGDTDGISSFRLNTKDAEVLGTLDPAQYNVSYHTSLADAQTSSATNPIDKNNGYEVTSSQQVFVRVENVDNTNCNAISDDTAGSTFMSFQLIVDPLPVVNTAQLIQCHNNPDLTTTVNLKLARPNISTNYIAKNEIFEYYRTLADASAGTPQITGSDVEMYPVTGTGEAWVRVFSEQACYRISKINITVNFEADLIYPKIYEECDDFLPSDPIVGGANDDTDGISYFDFSDSVDEIKNYFLVTSQPDLDVFFYETESDRTASLNEIPDITRHRNNNDPTYANNQTIYVKIVNRTNNGCSGTAQFSLVVKPVTLANTPTDFTLCDDDLSGSTTDGINTGINLRDKVDDILGNTQTETDYIVSFHTSATGANTNSDIITNDTNFTNSAPTGFSLGDISEQTIYVRVQDRNGTPQCFNDHVSFKIIINPIPVVSNTITPFAVCDIVTSSDSDTRNRIAQNIDLTSKDTEILDGKTNHRVAYYATQQDAQNGNEISNPTVFQNITSQTTFPADFNTDDPGIEIIFFKVFDLGGNMCESVFATFQLLIYPEPNIPINISDYSDCDNTTDTDQDDDNGRNGDITLKNKIPEILVNYDPSEYADFSVTFYKSQADADAGDKTLALDENKFENITNNQTVYVRVENIKNTPVICVHTGLSFNINIKPLPSFTVMGEENIDDPQIVCLNNTPLMLEAENAGAIYTYEWTDEAGNILGNASILNVTTAGKYTVTASDQFPDGCARTRTIVVKESDVAILEESFIIIIDESNNIGSEETISVQINTKDNYLGPGDYQFALVNNETGERFPSIGFQDEPLFENLEGGIYTVIVNDKNGCVADTTLEISVLQFPKFFTPNFDGTKDTWSVKGANIDFYPNASINIFNRLGKLVAQLSIDGDGWDGTYNGKPLSSDDYWFNITLIPANPTKQPINKIGHFSLLRR